MPLSSRALLFFAAFVPLTTAAQQPAPAPQADALTPTLTLGAPLRATKLESDDSQTRYQSGFFFDLDGNRVRIRDKDGRIAGDFNLRPQEKDAPMISPAVHDVAVFKDGSIAASWIYMLPHDSRRYFYLVHYNPTGNFLEQIDLGKWRAARICIADDQSIWTLSGEEEMGHSIYSPGEGVLRNYKFGPGLLRTAVPRSSFKQEFQNFYTSGHVAIDCSGNKVHALTGDGQWIEYTPGADFTITPVEPFPHSTFGDFWQFTGFASLDDGHAYAVIHSAPGDPFRRMFAELLPSDDGKALRWVEVPPDALPANNQPPSSAPHPADQSAAPPQGPIAVTGVVGADHENGEQLLYRTSKDETVLWSKPVLDGPRNSE